MSVCCIVVQTNVCHSEWDCFQAVCWILFIQLSVDKETRVTHPGKWTNLLHLGGHYRQHLAELWDKASEFIKATLSLFTPKYAACKSLQQ